MSVFPKVLVCSASPDRLNHNQALCGYLGRGFSEVLPRGHAATSSYEYAAEAAARFRPDVVVVFGSCMPSCCDYASLRTYCVRSGALLTFWLHDDPFEFDFNFKIYRYADFIFSNDKWAVNYIDHKNVYHLPLAADPNAHFRTVPGTIERDLFFCGVGYPNRQRLLLDCSRDLARFDVEVLGADWPGSLAFCHNRRVANDVLPDYYNSSRLTLNVGRRFNLANRRYEIDSTTPGPRTFEAAMAGTVQSLYVEGLEIADYFDIGDEILLFDSPSELSAQIEALRAAPAERERLALRSQDRALRDHTYGNRAKELLSRCGFDFGDQTVSSDVRKTLALTPAYAR